MLGLLTILGIAFIGVLLSLLVGLGVKTSLLIGLGIIVVIIGLALKRGSKLD